VLDGDNVQMQVPVPAAHDHPYTAPAALRAACCSAGRPYTGFPATLVLIYMVCEGLPSLRLACRNGACTQCTQAAR